ncbi:hypothetical protein JRO89_XS13G0104300 [Xanthoceras sorbifolium]|uniref:Glycosyltransferase n=1 Tax=Xanthoceras sorbifolium TaxID=99658 RepID=A0ABQ8H7M9_9ROSI|nr:hypothetical protein JRO89_XS13G0104300 [Xanthoceras sorbifolium]
MKRAELIFIPSPGIGHLVPTLEFAKLLIDRDDRILITVLVMKPSTSPHVEACTRPVAGSQSRIQLIELPQVDPPPLELVRRYPEYFITLSVESQVSNVRKVVSEIVSSRSGSDSVRVTGLVLDFFCVSMIDVASELGLPSYMYLTSNAGFLNFMLYLSTHHGERINSTEFEYSDSELLIPGFVNPVPVSVLPLCSFNKNGYTTFVKLAQRFRDVNGIIVNTLSELEPYTINLLSGGLNPPVYTVGPVLQVEGQSNPDSDEAQSRKIMRWLDDQPESSVVFLCFGSKGSFSPLQVKEMATGLEQSEYKFLWSLRISPPNNEVLVYNQSLNDDIFPVGFLERIRGRGMICEWAPQVEVLAHKAIGGFVSHCGWNSILESLWYGVPIVTWPLYAEQQLNAFKMVKELGLAVEMRLDSRRDGDLVMANEIEKAVRRVMDGDSEIRKKVKEMAEISRKSLMDGGSSFISIRQFIDLNF